MSPIFIFALLLLLCFAVLLIVMRPTQVESTVKRRLAAIEGGHAFGPTRSTILKEEAATPAPWLEDLTKKVPGSPLLTRLVKQAGKRWSTSYLAFFSVIFLIGVGWLVLFLSGSTWTAVIAGVAAGAAPILYLMILRNIRFNKCDELLPEAIDLMVRALRAGHAVSSAIEMIGNEVPEPLGSEFRTLHEEQSLGLPTREAMMNLVERIPRDDIRFLATAMLVQSETGGNLTQILDKTATLMRERVRLRGQLKIYTAQGRITGWILCAMPFLMFGLITLVNPNYEKVLLTDPLGVHMIYAGLAMMVIGILVIRRIIDLKV